MLQFVYAPIVMTMAAILVNVNGRNFIPNCFPLESPRRIVSHVEERWRARFMCD